ncbi:MAG: hypothetical protein ACRDHF_08870 [Tepidiformaceae bacterium]
MPGPQHPMDTIMMIAPRFDEIGLKWMLAGSVAGLMYGHTRGTDDIDIVFDRHCVIAPIVTGALLPEYSLDMQMFRDTLRTGMMCNAIAQHGGPKIDLVPLGDDLFSKLSFERRRRIEWHGIMVPVIREDHLVISKPVRRRSHSPSDNWATFGR